MTGVVRSTGGATRLRYQRLFGHGHMEVMDRVQRRSGGLRSALGAIIRHADSFDAAPLVTATPVTDGLDPQTGPVHRLEAVDEDQYGPDLARRLDSARIELFVGGDDWSTAQRVELRVVNGSEQLVSFPEGRQPEGELRLRQDAGHHRRIRNALYTLQNSPLESDLPLLRLFDDPSPALWPDPAEDNEVFEWAELTDDNRSGVDEQREFVRRVINGPDISLLEGPPGSGKTTVIVESIIQAVRRGRRVLLCAPTHAAVDNALERLEQIGALRSEGILAVRVASGTQTLEATAHLVEARVTESFRESVTQHLHGIPDSDRSESQRQLLSMVASGSEELGDLLLSAANLVCGTTIGIVRHRLFRGERSADPAGMFDHMILDEASKATLPEVLVPAIRATRWSFAGDIRQLSPTSVGDAAPILADRVQEAIGRLRRTDEPLLRFAVMTDAIRLERQRSGLLRLLSSDSSADSYMDIVSELAPHLNDRIVEAADDDEGLASSMLLRDLRDLDAETVLAEWSEELGWRLASNHSLRQSPQQERQALADQINVLTTSGSDELDEVIEMAVDLVEGVCLASMLETVQVGLGRRRFHQPSVLTDGLPPAALDARRVSLAYQHRMHSEISKFPRERFYSGALLNDADGLDDRRKWDFDRYSARSIWLDVPTADRSEPEGSVVSELESLIQWARSSGTNLSVAVISLYTDQIRRLRGRVRQVADPVDGFNTFRLAEGLIDLRLGTVDSFQGQEADVVYFVIGSDRTTWHTLSPNRINVALTRARRQLVVIGDHRRIVQSGRGPLCALAQTIPIERRWRSE